MPLKEREGNMYDFVSHTWNPVKGMCKHNCYYYYMKKWNKEEKVLYIDDTEFKTDMGYDNYIFVGSGTDLFASNIPEEWINKTLYHCYDANNTLFGETNKYLFQSKNPEGILNYINHPVFKNSVACTTIETDSFYKEVMGYAPQIEDRVLAMEEINKFGIETFVTIEPIMKFNHDKLVEYIRRCKPSQVNIGANSNEETVLPEPKKDEVMRLINELNTFTNVVRKDNLDRLL